MKEIRDTCSFIEYLPGEGEGNRSLGKRLYLAEDVYAVLFCSLFKTEYRESCMEDGSYKRSDADTTFTKRLAVFGANSRPQSLESIHNSVVN